TPRARLLLGPLLRPRQRARVRPLSVAGDQGRTSGSGQGARCQPVGLAHRPGSDLVRARANPDHVPDHQPSYLPAGHLARTDTLDPTERGITVARAWTRCATNP